MQADKGKPAMRAPVYWLVPKLKLDKDRNRFVCLIFSVKMNAREALTCDAKIAGAWEAVEDLSRQIEKVMLRSVIERVNIDFYDLPDSKQPFYHLVNVTLEALAVQRIDGQTYLYFSAQVLLSVDGIGQMALKRFGTESFCEFSAAQHTFTEWPEEQLRQEEKYHASPTQALFDEAMSDFVAPLTDANSGITSIGISIVGGPSVMITPEDAKAISKSAKSKSAGTAK
jgi:hypothetical protein